MSDYRFYLPDIGEGLQEAEIVNWLVSVNDHVVEDQPLVSIETDKALVDIPSPVSGTVTACIGSPGDIIKVGGLLAEFATDSQEDSGAIVGSLASAPASGGSVLASPAVRQEARRLGIVLETLQGSGRNGSITMADLQQGATAVSEATAGEEKLKGLRRTMFNNMTAARSQVAHATVTDHADIHHWPADENILLRMVQAIIIACSAEPALNCSVDHRTMSRRFNKRVNLGIAADTPDGLLVPTIPAANLMQTDELADTIERLLQAASERSLKPGQLKNQTITLSNFGSIAGEYAQMIVVPPQVAIVGAGRIRTRPVVTEAGIAAHAILPLSLSFDHSVVTGGEAARFLKALIDSLENNR